MMTSERSNSARIAKRVGETLPPIMESDATGASRSELVDLVDQYTTALCENSAELLPISPDVTFVENVERLEVGEGLWESASAPPTTFQLTVPDPVSGQVGFLGRMEEAGDPILLGLRLDTDGGEITEIEHVIARDLTPGSSGHTNLYNLETPRSLFREEIDDAHRHDREDLLEIARAYYDAVTKNDGSLAPFATNCVRIENGYQTTCKTPRPDPSPIERLWTLDAAEQLDAGAMRYISNLEPVRVHIADPDTGLVCGHSILRHPMESTRLDIEGVHGLETVDLDFDPFDTVAFHVFAISGGQIRAIEAVGFRAPYQTPTGWE